jgi:hypothetical protein
MAASAMKRTTIMLPEELRRRAISSARQRGVSLGELIRESLDAAMPAVGYEAGPDPLYADVVFDGPAPRDLSTRHDEHLYDEDE